MALSSKNTNRDDDVLSDQFQSLINLEGITLIWYDPNMNVTIREKLKVTKKHLRQINNFVIFEKDETTCINTIKLIKNEKILLVTSGSVADHLLSFDGKCIHKLVHAVFIFCRMKDKYQSLRRKHSKINEIFTDAEELKTAIKKEIDLIEEHFETFNFYNENEQNSIYDLSQQSILFVWLMGFKEVLNRMPKYDNSKAKYEMIETCKQYYLGNKKETNLIENFIEKYERDGPIYWYTRDSFVYRLVNQALRIGDVGQLYIFRLFIRDLCGEIVKRHEKITKQCSWLLYRGVTLPLEQVEKLKQSEGKLISTNGFLSTSVSEEVARRFALKKTDTDTEEFVLFEIECKKESATFAFLENGSAHPHEKEVLFDLGATFEVLSVVNSREEEAKINIWIVKLRSTQEGKKIAQKFVETCMEMCDLLHPSYVEISWGILLEYTDQPDKALKHYQKLMSTQATNVPIKIIHGMMVGPLISVKKLDKALEHLKLSRKKQQCDDVNLLKFYRTSGEIYSHKGLYDRAAKEYNKALQVAIVQLGEHHYDTAENYLELGATYLSTGQYQLALNNLINALKIYEKHYPDSNQLVGTFLFIADVYSEQKERDRAVEYYQKAVVICEKIYPETYSSIFLKAQLFHRLGIVLGDVSNLNLALQYACDALEIKKKDRQGAPWDTTDVLLLIGNIYETKGEFEETLKCVENALSQLLQLYDRVHRGVARLYHFKGWMLEHLGRNDEALTAFEAGLYILKQLFPGGHRELACSLNCTGNQYRFKKEFLLAKKYCEEALAMQKRLLGNHADTCTTLYHIGMILYDQQDYEESLSNLRKAKKIGKGSLGTGSHIQQASILKAIGNINRQMEKIPDALQYYKKAMSHYKKFFSHEHRFILELNSKIEEIEKKPQVL